MHTPKLNCNEKRRENQRIYEFTSLLHQKAWIIKQDGVLANWLLSRFLFAPFEGSSNAESWKFESSSFSKAFQSPAWPGSLITFLNALFIVRELVFFWTNFQATKNDISGNRKKKPTFFVASAWLFSHYKKVYEGALHLVIWNAACRNGNSCGIISRSNRSAVCVDDRLTLF